MTKISKIIYLETSLDMYLQQHLFFDTFSQLLQLHFAKFFLCVESFSFLSLHHKQIKKKTFYSIGYPTVILKYQF